jgi:hypothetical protein
MSSGRAGAGDVEGARDQFGHARRVVDLHHPLGHGAEDRAVVEFLEGLAAQRAARDLADEQQHRRRVLVRDVDAGGGVGGAGTARHEAHAGPAGELALGLGHHGRAAFLAAYRDVDGRVVQGVEHGQEAFARHAEELLHAVEDELVDQDLAAGARWGHGVRRIKRGGNRRRRKGACRGAGAGVEG